jgi:transcriptional regulator with XRE-family HTH domain
MNTMKLGRELAARRQKVGLTQAELARRMGTTQAAISRMEGGRVPPSLLLLERFAQATGGPLEIVVGEPNRIPSRQELRRRVRQVLGDIVFNPWDRSPTPAEAESLNADGLTRGRFESATAALRSSR